MRKAPNLIAMAALVLAAALCLTAAVVSVHAVERRAQQAVKNAMLDEGITWADARADGLLIHLSGQAPSEAARFRALSAAGSIIDAARVIDAISIITSSPIAPPQFSLELLRNETGVSMIGLVPAAQGRDEIATAVNKAARGVPVTDMLNVADYPAPAGWQDALSFGLDALAMLPRAKISVGADTVAIIAISDSAAQKRSLQAELSRKIPAGITAKIDISAPRPAITPFTLRLVKTPDGASFDACSADSETAAAKILAAAQALGVPSDVECTIGLGVPSPRWGDAVERAIAALAENGGGALTFSDADVTLTAPEGAQKGDFDRIAAALEADLPEPFTLHTVLPESTAGAGSAAPKGPTEFIATLSPEGLMQMRGRVSDELMRNATETFARARFGIANVHASLRLDAQLPTGWPLRVLTGLEALSSLHNGRISITPDTITLLGASSDPDARASLTRLLAGKLGEGQSFTIDVTYVEPATPETAQPSPEDCVAAISDIQAAQKITFDPGSVTLGGASLAVVDKIADILKSCPDVAMEIGGHTDSQGGADMNERLSQQRADSVLSALLARRVLTSNLRAKGYGESQPIAENDTEEGREQNRRIEFTLIAEPPQEGDAAQSETDSPDEQN